MQRVCFEYEWKINFKTTLIKNLHYAKNSIITEMVELENNYWINSQNFLK